MPPLADTRGAFRDSSPLPDPAPVPSPAPDVVPLSLPLTVLVLGPKEGEEEERLPAGGAEVSVRSAAGLLASGVTDAAGLCTLPDLPECDLVVEARRAGEAGIGFVEPERVDRNHVVLLEPEAWIAGVVVDARDGTPLDGAEVEILHGYRPDPGDFTGAVVAPDEGGPPVPFRALLASGRTGADGGFRFSVARARMRDGILVARAPSFAPGALASLDPDEVARLALDPAGIVRGRVLGPDGGPVAGAEVLALRGGDPLPLRKECRFLSTEPLVLRTSSGADGTFLLDGLPAGRALLFLAAKEGLGRSLPVDDAWIPLPGAGIALDLRIRRHPRLVVRVVGAVLAEGSALEVEALAPGEREPRRLTPLPGGDPATFALDAVPPGPLRVHAVAVVYHPT